MVRSAAKQAVENLLARFGDALRCVADFHIFATHYTIGNGHIVLKPHGGSDVGKDGGALPLVGQSGRIDFYLDVTMRYEVIEDREKPRRFVCRITGYSYHLYDLQEREILAFQWTPDLGGPFRFPHLHITAAGTITARDGLFIDRRFNLSNFHIPTGFIFIADVIELLIREFNVEPARRDWLEILNRNRSASPSD